MSQKANFRNNLNIKQKINVKKKLCYVVMKKLEWNWRVSVEQIKPGRKGQVLDLTLICGT